MEKSYSKVTIIVETDDFIVTATIPKVRDVETETKYETPYGFIDTLMTYNLPAIEEIILTLNNPLPDENDQVFYFKKELKNPDGEEEPKD